MTAFIIRSLLALGALFFTAYLFATGHWGWGITFIFPTAIIILSFFRNENMILALNQMRLGNQDKAKHYINKITRPDLMPKGQHAYVLFLQAVMNAQEYGLAKSEQNIRKALALGLRQTQDNAVARMHLAGICAQTGRKAEAEKLLAEAKKMDSTGMVREQINMLQQQMKMAPSKNQMRMAQMMGGRKKMPRMK
jgi:hypothetical protein